MIKADVLIVGTGIAGLYTALNLNENLNIILVTKSSLTESNSYLAQGGISTAIDFDDINSFCEDTIKAGNYKNNLDVVKMVATKSLDVIKHLDFLGVDFDKVNDGFSYTKEGGHSKKRIVHCKDYTGKEVIEKLLDKLTRRKNIKILEHTTLIDLITKDNSCLGGVFLNNEKTLKIYSKYTVLATGGIGGLFKNSTNQRTLTGDALSIALKRNIKLKDVEYVQFHPTSLYQNTSKRRFLISESLRGEGAILKNKSGNRFVDELLPRDKVTLAILNEIKKTESDFVYLDISHKNADYIKNRFPLIYSECLKIGIDITKEAIPVRPAQHYYMGGIEVDKYAKTSMNRLFAVGEVSCTGLHGSNRLASNSLLEGLVFGKNCASYINDYIYSTKLEILDININTNHIIHENKNIFNNKFINLRGDLKDELI